MNDYIVRATAAGGTIVAFATETTEMVKKSKDVHNLSPVATAALGRTLTAAAMMARQLKGQDNTLTIQVKGDGPLGGIVVVSDSQSNVRGYVHNTRIHMALNEQGKLDVGGAIGKNGYMNVIKDLGLKEPYIGYVDLVSGEIAEDLSYYFASSEQIPSVVSLGVKVGVDESVLNAGGFILQVLPGATTETIKFIEDRVNKMPSVTKLLSDGNSPEDILELLLGEKDLKIGEKSVCGYICNCSRERMEKGLISLGRKEIFEIVSKQEEVQVECHFCNRKYQFSGQELMELLKSLNNSCNIV